jgi:hypothetical protein
MMIVEAAQLYHGSNRLKKILGDEPDEVSPRVRERFFRELARDPRISTFLRARIEQRIRPQG